MANVTRRQIKELLERQQFQCALTGWKMTPETASLDHRTPLSKDGAHHLDNIQIVDWRANKAKGTMSNEEFVALCLAVTEHAHATSAVVG